MSEWITVQLILFACMRLEFVDKGMWAVSQRCEKKKNFHWCCQNQVTPMCLKRGFVRLHEENGVDYGFRMRFYFSEWHLSHLNKQWSHWKENLSVTFTICKRHSLLVWPCQQIHILACCFNSPNRELLFSTSCLFQSISSENIWLWLINTFPVALKKKSRCKEDSTSDLTPISSTTSFLYQNFSAHTTLRSAASTCATSWKMWLIKVFSAICKF